MEKTLLGFKVDYESISGSNFLVLTKAGLAKEQIIDFQVEMIGKHKIPGMLNLNIWEKNAEIKLGYNLSNRVALVNYLKRQKISKAEFINLLDRLVSTVLASEKNLLDEQAFIFDENFIYLDPQSQAVFIVYLPIKIEQDIVQAFKEFVINLIVNNAGNIEMQDNLMQQIFNLIKAEEFNFNNFSRQLKELKKTGGSKQTFNINSTQPVVKPAIPIQPVASKPAAPAVTPSEKAAQKSIFKNKKNQSKAKTKSAGKKTESHTVSLCVLAVVAILAVVIFTFKEDLLAIVPMDTTSSIYILAGAVMIGVGIIIATVFYFKNKSTINKAKAAAESNPQAAGDFQQQAAALPETASRQIAASVETSPPGSDDTVLLGAGDDDTVLLGVSDPNTPVLKAANGEEIININKPEFILGRKAINCDYVLEHKGIGRVHARVEANADQYFIVDLDSKNGTFINGTRLISNKVYPLNDGDQVKLADMEYSFQLNS